MAETGSRGSTRRAWRRVRLFAQRTWLRIKRLVRPILDPFITLWSRSLMVRTMTITGVVTGAMIASAGVFVLTSVSNDLYSSRRDQALQDSARATVAAQGLLDSFDTADRGGLSSLASSVTQTVQDTSASQMIFVRRQIGQTPFLEIPSSFDTTSVLVQAVSAELTASVRSDGEPQHWQPVTFYRDGGDSSPGIIVASSLTFPSGAGVFDLYIGYDLADTEQTLAFVARTLLLTAIAMMLFIGLLVLVISRIVFRPIRVAADTSRRLAAGEADARMPRQHDEHFDVLSDGFNDMADTLQARIRELDQLSIMQQRFVSDVSHELRTPLTTIRLASEVLKGEQDSLGAGQQRAVEVLSTQVERFELLLTDLLEISRYDAGRVTLETEPTNLVHLVDEVVASLQQLSPSVIEIRALGGYTPVDVDARRIRRIVSNLVGNAIEHGEGHPIVVTIDSNADATAIAVRDWGVGMSEQSVTHVFDRFWRADPSRKRTLGGTGLGLAIAREDAAVHGGLLDVWSRLEEGSQFRLTLPKREDVTDYMSPIPLVPEDVDSSTYQTDVTGGWLKRPFRRILRAPREGRS
ncbi:MtrAB system histidine kinase MtrB [Leucobacter denitrificans]|uniref:Sensor histidine kinase MtrB n=1 Tax=Leucobacter denitrificans TaxID=683042 RepID=A0A7G9S3P0_9MICO|nr:MtrAB system histidine kinase MtrB [Leucobacter denitrificans]QNN62465.1 HAMP domain-containing histidine kinase [Leucobacter denitrificans]